MSPQFCYQVCTRHGVLAQQRDADFLALIVQARASKSRWSADLPHSLLRVKLLAPNGDRVPTADVKSALQALSDPQLLQVVFGRISARFFALEAARAGRVFCQAGVVAPPDSPDLGNSPISPAVVSGV